MLQLINLSSDRWSLEPFRDAAALRLFYESEGCNGIELILCGEDFQDKILPGMVKGLHLVFYPEWICLWENDFSYMDKEFGSRDMWEGFYALKNRDELLAYYKHELELAKSLGAKYVVFHMGDNAVDEYFTLNARHSVQRQLEASCDFLNQLFGSEDLGLDLLLENMWLGCMNLTNPEHTAFALSHINYPRTGLMLDTGHFLCTNPKLRNMEEACEYLHSMLDSHGELSQRIYGMHLQASLSGEYISQLPLSPPTSADYLERYSEATKHLRAIDRHMPFVADGLTSLIQRISPKYLCHELYHGRSLEEWQGNLRAQIGSINL